ncbi:DUF6076 domain-containing protein [uncultured Gemmiger sp.]|uniref:DUF6076 domain-containing protein n=1 Tax=uncultured Gemmiger sp. TaxID=1623490 RepID=UPI0025DD717E|nr:DUF6076 domain-containing protein [uncultured Gemmiger sp.]
MGNNAIEGAVLVSLLSPRRERDISPSHTILSRPILHIRNTISITHGQWKNNCQHCGMLFLSKNTGAKCCNRKSPNGGQCTCRKVRKEERACEREVSSPFDILNKVNKRMNGRLAHAVGMTTERRAGILKIWRKEVKPLVNEATDHPETFDEEAFGCSAM